MEVLVCIGKGVHLEICADYMSLLVNCDCGVSPLTVLAEDWISCDNRHSIFGGYSLQKLACLAQQILAYFLDFHGKAGVEHLRQHHNSTFFR